MATKTFLDSNGARYLVQKVKTIVNQPMNFASLNNKPNTLAGYGITDAATSAQVVSLESDIARLQDASVGVYHYKGSVANLEALANVEPEEGDTYNLSDTGMNVAYVAPKGDVEGHWDELGSTIDLSGYVKVEDFQAMTEKEIDNIFMRYFPLEADSLTDLKKYFNTEGEYVNVKLNNSMNLDSQLTVPEGKKATIDLNGNTLTTGNGKVINVNGGELTIEGEGTIINTNAGGADNRPIQVVNEGILNINGGNIINNRDCAVNVNSGTINMNDGYVQAQEVGILGFGESVININGGTIKGIDNFAVGGNGSAGLGGTTINITGGHIEGNIQSAGYVACAIYHPQDGILNVSGGEIVANGGCGILMRAGQLNMTGGEIRVTGAADLLGKVGDSKVTVGPHGVIYDQLAHYPDNQNLEVVISNGSITSEHGKSVEILKDADHVANVSVIGGTLNPEYEG